MKMRPWAPYILCAEKAKKKAEKEKGHINTEPPPQGTILQSFLSPPAFSLPKPTTGNNIKSLTKGCSKIYMTGCEKRNACELHEHMERAKRNTQVQDGISFPRLLATHGGK